MSLNSLKVCPPVRLLSSIHGSLDKVCLKVNTLSPARRFSQMQAESSQLAWYLQGCFSVFTAVDADTVFDVQLSMSSIFM